MLLCPYWKCRLHIEGCGFGFGSIRQGKYVIHGDPRCNLCNVWNNLKACELCIYYKHECNGIEDTSRYRKLGRIQIKHHVGPTGCNRLWRDFGFYGNEICPFCSNIFEKIQHQVIEHKKENK